MDFNLDKIAQIVFFIVCLFVAYFLVSLFKSIISKALRENLPLKYIDVKDNFGDVLHKNY